MSRTVLSGWGNTAPSAAEVVRPEDERELVEAMCQDGPIIARGLGRSYGDAAQSAGGTVISNLGLSGIGPIDRDGLVSVGAGVSFDELLRTAIPKGWFVPVTPGTRQVSIGGALAADVHGKNHHRDGSIGAYVTQMRLVCPDGPHVVSPGEDSELFWATVGGMGLTGVLSQATLRMRPIETDQVLVDTERFGELDSIMAEMERGDRDWHYSVAWVDCMTRGARMGRGILTRGEHALTGEVTQPTRVGPSGTRLGVPFRAPGGLLNRATVQGFNEAWFRLAPKHEMAKPTNLSAFFHPLDGIRDWNRLYGKRGFVQYQFCVPDGSGETVVRAIEKLSSSKVPSFLAVLKRFGSGNESPLSFPMAGWTLALDLPVGPAELPRLLDDLDSMVIEAEGRVYLAKDARLDPAKMRAMYPELDRFLEVKERVDPEHRLVSDLSRRLGIGA